MTKRVPPKSTLKYFKTPNLSMIEPTVTVIWEKMNFWNLNLRAVFSRDNLFFIIELSN